MTSHAKKAAEFASDLERAHWHDRALWYVREKRDKMARSVPEWEKLREIASQIKLHTLSRLDSYLEEFERNARQLGAHVYWARDAEEHNAIVYHILQTGGCRRVVKSKSMLTEECGLNHFLESKGIEITDTDLGEWIVQLRKEAPSHIVLPAIHVKKEEISELFEKHIGTETGNADPAYLTEASREALREKYLQADAAISGVNFAVAESGALVVCTNEGNADVGTSLANVHIACLGIEKLIPRNRDLGVFLRLLARSATGQPITTYSTHYLGPRRGGELHIVLVDNGRSAHRQKERFSRSLSCIRCGACMNTCPVYRRSGGYSYDYTIPGPIGAVLAPHRDMRRYASLPFASSLCGSCTDVCPVKINLHEQLLFWREEIERAGYLPISKKIPLQIASYLFRSAKRYERFGKIANATLRWLPKKLLYSPLNVWGRNRELPQPPEKTFREMYRSRNLLQGKKQSVAGREE